MSPGKRLLERPQDTPHLSSRIRTPLETVCKAVNGSAAR